MCSTDPTWKDLDINIRGQQWRRIQVELFMWKMEISMQPFDYNGEEKFILKAEWIRVTIATLVI